MKMVFEKVKADKRIIIGYGLSLLLLLVAYFITISANEQLKKNTAAVDHTYRLIANLEVLISRIKDAETGVRGYALTKDTSFLQPYINSKSATDSIYAIIVNQSSGNQVQTDRLKDLGKAIKKRFEILIASLAYLKDDRSDTAFNLKGVQLESKRVMNDIRYYVDIIQKEERIQLSLKDAALKSTIKTFDRVTIISLLFTLLLIVIGFITYTKENKDKKIAMGNIKVYQQQLSNRINELSDANAELIQMKSMEKFAATGRIARTIAHEVRNPLTNINLANSQLRSDIADPGEDILHLLGIIDRNSQRINKLISDLLQSTKFTELSYTTVSINKVLNESLAMAEDRFKLKKIKLEKDYGKDCNVKVDTDKIKIPFLNIIINAIEAMEEEKGVLTVRTTLQNNKCVIAIIDNGTGMDNASLSKLFEPYFTTKPKGNGLGLTNTQNIILNHQGTINVESKPGKGTTFTIKLNIA